MTFKRIEISVIYAIPIEEYLHFQIMHMIKV